LTLSFPDWQEAQVAPATYEVTIGEGESY
jgi:hypothetical protein